MTNKEYSNRLLINSEIRKSFSNRRNWKISKTRRKWPHCYLKKKWYYRLAIRGIISKSVSESSIVWWKRRLMLKWLKVYLCRGIISFGRLSRILKIKIIMLKIFNKLKYRLEWRMTPNSKLQIKSHAKISSKEPPFKQSMKWKKTLSKFQIREFSKPINKIKWTFKNTRKTSKIVAIHHTLTNLTNSLRSNNWRPKITKCNF